MRTFRYLLRLILAFFNQFKGLLLISSIIGIIAFILISLIAPLVFNKRIQKIGLSGRYNTQNMPAFILQMIGDGLTATDSHGTPEPKLAVSWETPDKGSTWIFTLDTSRIWHDGEEIESEDISYNFSDVEIERPDEHTIIFKLQEPFIPFPSVVSRPVFKKGLLGTGEWKVEKASLSAGNIQKLILKDKDNNKIIFKFYPTEDEAKLAFKLGEVDEIVEVIDPTPLNQWGGTKTIEKQDLQKEVVIFFNITDKYLSDKTLRQSLIYAINKNELGEKRAFSPISPDSWVFNPQVKKYSFDQERAKKILDELPDEQKEGMAINLVSAPVLLPIAERIAGYWNVLGINTSVQVTSIIPSEFSAFLTIYDIPKDPDQYSLWHSTQIGTNISRYQNPRIDKLLEDGRVELNVEERKKIYLDFQRFIVEDSPAAFLYHPTTYTISRK